MHLWPAWLLSITLESAPASVTRVWRLGESGRYRTMIGFLLVLAMVQIAVQATSLLILTVAGNPAGAEACIKGFQAAGGGADADDGEARVRHFASALAAQVDYRPVKLSTSKSRHNPAVQYGRLRR